MRQLKIEKCADCSGCHTGVTTFCAYEEFYPELEDIETIPPWCPLDKILAERGPFQLIRKSTKGVYKGSKSRDLTAEEWKTNPCGGCKI